VREQRQKDQGLKSRRVDLEVHILAGLDERRRPKTPLFREIRCPPIRSFTRHVYPLRGALYRGANGSPVSLSDLGSVWVNVQEDSKTQSGQEPNAWAS
jgi:hypothetical protein